MPTKNDSLHGLGGQIGDAVNRGFRLRRIFLYPAAELLPDKEKWNSPDPEKQAGNSSIAYDYFDVSKGRIGCCISRCVNAGAFETYGTRSLSRLLCVTDVTAYKNLPKHAGFIRHSDLTGGACCFDAIIDKGKTRNYPEWIPNRYKSDFDEGLLCG